MTLPMRRTVTLLAVLGLSSHAYAQPADELAIRTEAAPWGNPLVLPACDGTLLISDEHVDEYGELVEYRMYSSVDGSRWQRDVIDDHIMLIGTQCIDGVTWGHGHPAIIARRDARGHRRVFGTLCYRLSSVPMMSLDSFLAKWTDIARCR